MLAIEIQNIVWLLFDVVQISYNEILDKMNSNRIQLNTIEMVFIFK
jgi:hypothetical protein